MWFKIPRHMWDLSFATAEQTLRSGFEEHHHSQQEISRSYWEVHDIFLSDTRSVILHFCTISLVWHTRPGITGTWLIIIQNAVGFAHTWLWSCPDTSSFVSFQVSPGYPLCCANTSGADMCYLGTKICCTSLVPRPPSNWSLPCLGLSLGAGNPLLHGEDGLSSW